jgi:DNA segregation ATPase FtsK/SpoIIIE, S-DNA-T family
MNHSRLIRVDGISAGFLGAGAVLTAALVQHNPANADGLAGALLFGLGFGTHALVTAWLLLAVNLFVRRNYVKWTAMALGWLVLIFATAIGAEWWGSSLAPIQWPGPGGSIGLWLAGWLETLLHPMGAVLAWTIGAILGLSLAANSVVRFALVILHRAPRVAAGGLRAGAGLIPKRRPAAPGPVNATVPAAAVDDDGIPITRPRPIAELEREAELAATLAEMQSPEKPQPLRVVRPGPTPDSERFNDYQLPPLALLEDPLPFPFEEHDRQLREQAILLEKTFKDFELNVRVVAINTGPVITQYEVALETGLRVNKITGLGDDLALNLKVPSVRIVAPIPGKNTVGIEVPNERRAIVRMKEILLAANKKANKAHIPLFVGKDTEGRPLVYDLAEMPHLLIAGRTGTGKSVCLNAIILSMLMTRRPDDLKLILIDPKRTELIEYGRLPHLMHPVVTDAKKAEAILAWAVDKMEERYDILSRARVRNIAAYNELSHDEIMRRVQPADDEERARIPAKMPWVVLIVDELGDLMMQMKREIEGHIIRLAQKSRAAGIHLVVATQKPTVDVITGLIKSNLPARICFQVSSRSDSRVVLDEMGADKLLGKGDMLFLQPGTGTMIRAQGAYASDMEITRVVEHLDCDPCFAPELLNLETASDDEADEEAGPIRPRDPVYEQAISIVVREGRGSVSLLQRALGIGYGRAARLIDFMAEDGIVGAYNGSNAREVLYTPDQWARVKQNAAS